MTKIAAKFRRSLSKAVCTPLNRLLNLVDAPVVVLLYHRVTTLACDPELLAVSPDNFLAQMRHLKETVSLVGFEEDWTKVPRPAVAITFDDGYADNVLEALPILDEVGVPATFFVSTGTIGTSLEFWWHELERTILEKRSLPTEFTLEDGCFSRSWPTGTSLQRQEFYREMLRLMSDADPQRRSNWRFQLRRWAQTGEGEGGRHRAMTVDELRLLAGKSGITIGAHTVTHSRLSTLSREAQRDEMLASKAQIESWLGRGIDTFSYPFGRRCDYTKQSMALCRQAGFTKAAANFPGQAHLWTDPYQIPRHLVRNWPVETFAQKLREFWTR